VLLQRAPAWTTDWISPAGRRKLQDYGIAPPGPVASALTQPLHFVAFRAKPAALACPRCDSHRTERLSAFGSTACKSLHRCLDCLEPFEHFKPI
jgi:ring-1,2-phenylacetyl-CoA epoxidase subunit PaaD